MAETPELYMGLLSGTSADAVDAALVEVTSPRDQDFQARLVAFRECPLEPALRRRVLGLCRPGPRPELDVLDELLDLDVRLGEVFLAAARAVLAEAGVEARALKAVGHHGQTVRHRPPTSAGARGGTLQIGSAAILGEGLGVTVVHDLRSRDMALGGQGAPLVPLLDRLLLAAPEVPVVALNLGGIANLTRVPPRGSSQPLVAYDSGPANTWIDAAARLADLPGGRDEGGARARAGTVDEPLLAELLGHPYFARPAPKSTGPEEFSADAVEAMGRGRRLEDLLATLVELTARSVAGAVRALVPDPRGLTVVAAGGGTANPFLMERLAAALPGVTWTDTGAHGVPPAAKEAFAFAVLAARAVHGLPGNVPSVTGARAETVLGSLLAPPGP